MERSTSWVDVFTIKNLFYVILKFICHFFVIPFISSHKLWPIHLIVFYNINQTREDNTVCARGGVAWWSEVDPQGVDPAI